jgi:hypothetical protein
MEVVYIIQSLTVEALVLKYNRIRPDPISAPANHMGNVFQALKHLNKSLRITHGLPVNSTILARGKWSDIAGTEDSL